MSKLCVEQARLAENTARNYSGTSAARTLNALCEELDYASERFSDADKRIKGLEAQLEAVRLLPEKWMGEPTCTTPDGQPAYDGFDPKVECAVELQQALENES